MRQDNCLRIQLQLNITIQSS